MTRLAWDIHLATGEDKEGKQPHALRKRQLVNGTGFCAAVPGNLWCGCTDTSQRPSAKRGVHDRGFLKCLLRLRGECRHNFVRLSKKS